jgi:hypothetical protein
MVLKYKKQSSFSSKGIQFIPNKEYTVDDKVGEYLLKYFGDSFEVIEQKVKPKDDKKSETKTSTKPARGRRTKATN